MEDTVISPPNSERPPTWIWALAVVTAPAEADTEEETEPALAIDPSPGYAKLPPTPTASGGALTTPPLAPPCPGTETWIPTAFALGVPWLVADGAPEEPVSARTAMKPIRADWRLDTGPQIIGNRFAIRDSWAWSRDARAALPTQHDIVVVDAERRSPRNVVDHVLESFVAESLDPAAVPTDEVMVMGAARLRPLVVRAGAPELQPMDEPELGERLQRPVDARDPDPGTMLPDEVVNRRDGEAAGLLAERRDHGRSRLPGLVPRLVKHGFRVVAPGHAQNDSRSHFLIACSLAMARIILVLMLTGAGVVGCGGGDDDSVVAGDTRHTSVVASFYPLAFAAAQVSGARVGVRNLTPVGAEPHDVELTARDVERIRSADFVLYLSGGFQPAVEDALGGASGDAVDLLVDPIAGDPHVWLDPRRYETIATRTADALGGDATELTRRLRRLDRDYAKGLADCRSRELVTSHEAFGYLASRYHLKQIAITGITPEAEPAPRELERVVAQVKATGATTVFFETLVSPRLAETVARETNARTDVLNPIEGLTADQLQRHENYLTLMRENLAALRKALGCR
jgi:zinc transport system substrate-binding protein